MDATNDKGVMVGGDGKFVISVNDVQLQLAEPVLDGRRILEDAGFRPTADHVLIRLLLPGTRSVGLDERLSFAVTTATRSALSRVTAYFGSRSMIGVTSGASPRSRSRSCAASLLCWAMGFWCWSGTARPVELAADDIIELGQTGTERLRVVEFVTVYLNTLLSH